MTRTALVTTALPYANGPLHLGPLVGYIPVSYTHLDVYKRQELMNKALIAAGNPPEGMIIQSGEMHGFYNVENRVNLYSEMLKFFGRHIGGSVNTGKVEQVK